MVDEEPLMKLVGVTKRFGHVIALKAVSYTHLTLPTTERV